MLKKIDKFYKYLLITILVVYLINFAYFGEITITFTAIALTVILEILKHRHYFKQFSPSQFSIIAVILLAGIAGTIYCFVLFHIFLNSFSFPSVLEDIFLLAVMILCLYVLMHFFKKLYSRAIEKH